MSLDSPARIAVIGAGPIGLEAALYGRFLGYEVDLYERGSIAANVKKWGHVRMFTPFRLNRSSLALAALTAQEPLWKPPHDDALLTGREFVDHYLLPLAESDLLEDRIHQKTTVLALGKEGVRKGELAGQEERGDEDFFLLVKGNDGRERIVTADAVIDTSGTYGNHNWLGRGGIPAIGELAAEPQIEYGLPDVLGGERDRYAGKRTLLIGNDESAATTVVALAELAKTSDDTSVTWITLRGGEAEKEGPVRSIPSPVFPQRDEVIQAANRLAKKGGRAVKHWPGTAVESVKWSEKHRRFDVLLAGEHAGELEVDRIIANVGYRPDYSLLRELHLQPAATSESTLAQGPPEQAPNPERLLTAEEHFYVLGAKSYGRDSRFLITDGLRQIRDLFTLIGDRENLDLYATIGREGLPD
jgi:thioredoxin reductase